MDIKQLFNYAPPKTYDFSLKPEKASSNRPLNLKNNIYPNYEINLKFVQEIYNTSINSDIMIREFLITIKGIHYKAFLLYIDGMIDANLINHFVLSSLMIKKDIE